MLPHLHVLAQAVMQQATELAPSISVGLLVLIEIQVANLQVKVTSLMEKKGKKK